MDVSVVFKPAYNWGAPSCRNSKKSQSRFCDQFLMKSKIRCTGDGDIPIWLIESQVYTKSPSVLMFLRNLCPITKPFIATKP